MSCKGWGCFVSSPDADRMRRLESRDYSCKPELQARDFSREKLTNGNCICTRRRKSPQDAGCPPQAGARRRPGLPRTQARCHALLNTRIGIDDYDREELIPHKNIEKEEREFRAELESVR